MPFCVLGPVKRRELRPVSHRKPYFSGILLQNHHFVLPSPQQTIVPPRRCFCGDRWEAFPWDTRSTGRTRPPCCAFWRRHPHSPEGAILRLAWLEGLSRSEITELRWDQVDFEGKAIQLPDRTVPLEPSTETCLRERHARCALRDPHVVISERSKKPMPPESISRLSRLALDSEGQKVNLMDLRHDFVIRQLQTHDWPYVARVSGMAVSTLRDAFSPYLTKPAAPENPLAQRDEAEYLLWRVIQQEGSSPAGLALWMGWKLQMQPGEIASLTWGQVDFDQNLIRLPDRMVSMGSRLDRKSVV